MQSAQFAGSPTQMLEEKTKKNTYIYKKPHNDKDKNNNNNNKILAKRNAGAVKA